MIHPYPENSTSTGEPPTPESSPTSETEIPSDSSTPGGSSERGSDSERQRSPRLSAQEQDSGYEASPSSLRSNVYPTLRYLREQTSENQTVEPRVERHHTETVGQVMENRHSSSGHFSDCESEADVNECEGSCDCNSVFYYSCPTNDSFTPSTTLSTVNAITGDLNNCDNNSNVDMSSSLPSSVPIQIPVRTCYCSERRQITQTNSSSSPQVDLRLQPNRSYPASFHRASPSLHTVNLIANSQYHPLSWTLYNGTPRRMPGPIPIPTMSNNLRSTWESQRSIRSNQQEVRSRRRQIDSDASEYSSSDDGPDEVFEMASGRSSSPYDMSPLMTSGIPTITNGGTLPDVVDSDSIRRRAMSVSLPLDPEVLQNIGRSLRRLSDQFDLRRRREVCPSQATIHWRWLRELNLARLP